MADATARAAATATVCACRPPSDIRLAGRWIEAEAIAIRRLADDACASVRSALHLELGRIVERDADRLDALDDYRVAHRAGDAAAVADAAARHRDAADRETAFGLSAWALVAAGAGLGLAAALVWPSASDSGDVALAPGPVGLSLHGRF